MVVFETAAIFGGLKELFLYNRTSYQYNKSIDQERLYHLQKMRMEQVKLYREDIRDLFGLTVGKMDNYYMINTITLGFSLGFYYEGKIPSDTPAWLFYLWSMSIGTAILFLMLSIWFAIHASVTAQALCVRILTQWLRLPIPGIPQIDIAAAKLRDFEAAPASQIMRVPMVTSALAGDEGPIVGDTPGGTHDPAVTADHVIQEGYHVYMGHFFMYQKLSHHWQALDAYTRACMVIGANQLLNVVVYTALAYFIEDMTEWGAWAFVLVPLTFAAIHAQMNLLLTYRELTFFVLVHVSGPLLAAALATGQVELTSTQMNPDAGEALVRWLSPIAFFLHTVSFGFLYFLGLERTNGLPTKFATVVSIDVLGLPKEPPPSETPAGPPQRLPTHVFSDDQQPQPQERGNNPFASILTPLAVPPAASPPTGQSQALRRAFSSMLGKGNLGAPMATHLAADPTRSAWITQPAEVTNRRYLSATKREPPVKDVIPRARALSRGASLYQQYVEAAAAGNASAVGSAALPPRPSVSLPPNLPPSVGEPAATTPTPSEHENALPPVNPKLDSSIADMPFSVFRQAGAAVLALWLAGIVISVVMIWDISEVGWENRTDPIHSRRLLEVRRPARVALWPGTERPPYLSVDGLECRGDAMILTDDNVRRAFIAHLNSTTTSAPHDHYEQPVPHPLSPGGREYALEGTSVRVPLDHSDLFLRLSGLVVDSNRVYATSRKADYYLHWDAATSAFKGAVDLPTSGGGVAGICRRSTGLVLVTTNGDAFSI